MKSKKFFLMVALLAVGLFALPETLALFSGQHTFDKSGDTALCGKCHADVEEELSAGIFHKSLFDPQSADPGPPKCKACHTTDKVNSSSVLTGRGRLITAPPPYVMVGLDVAGGNFTQANGTNITGIVAHAAVTVECKSCHYAVNFTNDAHKRYAEEASNQTWLKGANEACVGCHTKTLVNMTWTRNTGYIVTYRFQDKNITIAINETYVNTTTNNTGI